MKKGWIVPNGVVLEKHEYKTVVLLTELGLVVELIPPRPTKYQSKTADAKINGKCWEIKCPRNNGKYTIDHMLQAAEAQSENLIVDLRRAKAPARSLAKIRYGANKRSKLKNVIVILKSGKTLDIKGAL